MAEVEKIGTSAPRTQESYKPYTPPPPKPEGQSHGTAGAREGTASTQSMDTADADAGAESSTTEEQTSMEPAPAGQEDALDPHLQDVLQGGTGGKVLTRDDFKTEQEWQNYIHVSDQGIGKNDCGPAAGATALLYLGMTPKGTTAADASNDRELITHMRTDMATDPKTGVVDTALDGLDSNGNFNQKEHDTVQLHWNDIENGIVNSGAHLDKLTYNGKPNTDLRGVIESLQGDPPKPVIMLGNPLVDGAYGKDQSVVGTDYASNFKKNTDPPEPNHFITVTGYTPDAKNPNNFWEGTFTIQDPILGEPKQVSYAELKSFYEAGGTYFGSAYAVAPGSGEEIFK